MASGELQEIMALLQQRAKARQGQVLTWIERRLSYDDLGMAFENLDGVTLRENIMQAVYRAFGSRPETPIQHGQFYFCMVAAIARGPLTATGGSPQNFRAPVAPGSCCSITGWHRNTPSPRRSRTHLPLTAGCSTRAPTRHNFALPAIPPVAG